VVGLSLITSIVILYAGIYICYYWDIPYEFPIFLHFLFVLTSIFKSKSLLQAKAIAYFLGLFWLFSISLDILSIDILEFYLIPFALILYILSAKRIIKTPTLPNLNFNTNYIIHCKPFKARHWIWLLLGKDMDAFRWFYDSKREILMRMEGNVLVERRADHKTILKGISAVNGEVSSATVSYAELKKKLGTKINCKKEIY